ncbi:MAG: septation protein A [Planctomycetota bacterium]|nr:septation protein A [Planctomycetota bacterium]MDG1491218.1 septation protein A [Planctomycetota bacterium]
MATSPDSKTTASALSPQLKLALDMGPLIVFFVTFFVAKRVVEDDTQGMIWATGIFVVVTTIALAVSYAIERKLHAMPLITGAVVLVMGGLTVYFNDERFIKYKPTIVSGLMGSTLLIGWARGKSLIKPLLGSTLELDDAGWRTLTLRWGFFFLVVAGLNELVWRSTTTSVWLNFKLFGILGLTFLFMLLQQPLIQRHSPAPPTED